MMKAPWWNKTITVFTPHYDEKTKTTVWTKQSFDNCFWGRTSRAVVNTQEWFEKNAVTVRIPTEAEFEIIPMKSVLICQRCSDRIPDSCTPVEILKRYPGSITAQTVSCVQNMPLKHVHITGA